MHIFVFVKFFRVFTQKYGMFNFAFNNIFGFGGISKNFKSEN